jgi:phage-related protein
VALNFLGLGFSFGAKDLGLERFQTRISKGFGRISSAMNIFGTNAAKPFDKMGSKIAEVEEPFSRFGMDVGTEFNRVDEAVVKSISKFDTMKDSLRTLAKRGLSVLGAPFVALAQRFKRKGVGDIESGGKKVVDVLGKMKNSMQVFNDILRQNKLQTFIQSVALDRLNKIADGIQHVGEAGQHLTTGLEAEMTAMAKTARASAVNMGLMGKDVGKFTGKVAGMAKGLNIDVGTAADATWGWTQAMGELRAVGIRSASDLAKLSEVTGLNTKEFALSLKTMRAQFQMTDKDMQMVVGSFTSLGQATGDVGGALGHIPQMMDLISRHAVSMGKKLSPAQLADYAAQTAAVAAGFGRLGKTQTQAMEIATKLADTLVGEQENMQNMFTGTSDELGQFTERLAITTGDVQDAFKLMRSGPQGMIQGIAQMVMKAKKSGKNVTEVMNFMAGNLRGVLGEQMTADLVNMFGNADDALLKTMADTKSAVKPLHKLADAGFSTGRTLEDAYNMMRDSAISRFRAISNAGGKFVTDSGREFKHWGDIMAKTAAKGGPMGMVIRKMSEMNIIGIKALLPETLRPMAAVFGEMTAQITPMIGALGALGFRFTMLLSPVGLLVMGLVAFGAMLVDARMKSKSWGEALRKVIAKVEGYFKSFRKWVTGALDTALNYLVKFTDMLAAKAKAMDWKKFFVNLFAKLGNAVVSVAKFIARAVGSIWDGIQNALSGTSGPSKTRVGRILDNLISVFKGVFSGLFAAIGKIDFGRVLSGVFDSLLKVVRGALKFLGSDTAKSLLDSVITFLGDHVKMLGHAVLNLVNQALDFLANLDVARALAPIVTNVLDLLAGALGKLIDALGPVLSGLPGLLIKAFDIALDFVKKVPDLVATALKKLGPKIGPLLGKVAGLVLDLLWDVTKSLPHVIWAVLKALPDILMGLGKLLLSVASFLEEAVVGILDGIRDWLTKKMPWAAGIITGIFGTLKFVLTLPFKLLKIAIHVAMAVIEEFVGLIKFLGTVFQVLWTVVKTVFTAIGGIIKFVYEEIVKPIAKAFGITFTDVWTKVIQPIWEAVPKWFSDLFTSIKNYILADIQAVVDIFENFGRKAKDALGGIMDKVKSLFGHSMNTIIGADMEKTVQVMNDAANTIMDMLEKKIFDVVVSAFPKAFEAAFKKSDAIFDKFTKYQTAHFQKFLDNLIDRFGRAWKSIIDMTSSAMQDIGKMIADVTASLAKTQFAYAQMQVEKGKAETAAKDAKAAKEADKVDEKSLSLTDRLIRATHHPDWYHDDYKTLFITQMSALTTQLGAVATAIARSGGATKGGSINPTQAKKKIDDYMTQGKGLSPSIPGKT